jgi:hypothetical protein
MNYKKKLLKQYANDTSISTDDNCSSVGTGSSSPVFGIRAEKHYSSK